MAENVGSRCHRVACAIQPPEVNDHLATLAVGRLHHSAEGREVEGREVLAQGPEVVVDDLDPLRAFGDTLGHEALGVIGGLQGGDGAHQLAGAVATGGGDEGAGAREGGHIDGLPGGLGGPQLGGEAPVHEHVTHRRDPEVQSPPEGTAASDMGMGIDEPGQERRPLGLDQLVPGSARQGGADGNDQAVFDDDGIGA